MNTIFSWFGNRLCVIQKRVTPKDLHSSILLVSKHLMQQWMQWTDSIYVIDRLLYHTHLKRTQRESGTVQPRSVYWLHRIHCRTLIGHINCLPMLLFQWWWIHWCHHHHQLRCQVNLFFSDIIIVISLGDLYKVFFTTYILVKWLIMFHSSFLTIFISKI